MNVARTLISIITCGLAGLLCSGTALEVHPALHGTIAAGTEAGTFILSSANSIHSNCPAGRRAGYAGRSQAAGGQHMTAPAATGFAVPDWMDSCMSCAARLRSHGATRPQFLRNGKMLDTIIRPRCHAELSLPHRRSVGLTSDHHTIHQKESN